MAMNFSDMADLNQGLAEEQHLEPDVSLHCSEEALF